MDQGVDRKDEAEQQQVRNQRGGQPRGGVTCRPCPTSKQERDRRQQPGPEDGLARRSCLGLGFGTQKAWGEGLHRAASDDPERKVPMRKNASCRPSAVPSDSTAWK
jgi:hypothetical protein